MCGIFGCILKEGDAGLVIHEALKRLEYRGYDSVGQAIISSDGIAVKKDKGKISEVHKALNLDDMDGKIGIGHTRWATHGAPSMRNAHPHLDCEEKIAIVHNGIIENFLEIKKELEEKGHVFRSETDSEVVSHLIEDYIREGDALKEATRMAAKKLEGSFAILVISPISPNEIICVRKESPLTIGIGKGGVYCASDTSAFLPLTKNALIMDDQELAILKLDDVQLIKYRTGEKVQKDLLKIDWSLTDAMKEKYPYFTLKEIYEQPASLRNALRIHPVYNELIASKLIEYDRIFLIACGTSYHACLAGTYLFSKISKVDSRSVIASEFMEQYEDVVDSNTMILAISQSGETADTLEILKAAKRRNAAILSVTNVIGSSITRLSDIHISQNSGPEIGVAATKSYTSQLMILYKLAITLGSKKNSIFPKEKEELEKNLEEMPIKMKNVLKKYDNSIRNMARKNLDAKSFCFLGRGINYATALEARLKLLELSYVPSLAFPAGEIKHGFIATVEEGSPAIFIAPKDDNHKKIIGNIMEMKARGAKIISLIEEGDNKIRDLSDDYFEMPKMPSLLTPLAYIAPLQLFAYHMAVEKGLDPDKPRNLAKSVTVE